MMALIAHAALVAMLAVGVNWRSSSPTETIVAAELWAAVPEIAAPKPVEPPPQPTPKPVEKPQPDPRIEQQQRDAQIAIEKAERDKKRKQEELEEKLKQDKLKEEKLKEEKKRTELAAKMREQQLARLRDLAGATGPGAPTSTGTAQRDAAPSKDYGGRIKARVKPNILLTAEILGNPIAEVEVRCAPDGRIVGRRIVTPSGNPLWDETVLRAIDRTEVFPRDIDGRVPSPMLLKFARQE
ncbi:cell envelope integrity protein TolA [Aquincola sp. S2]|uniref:Cell envelope integrity protein TolA n=2 Tax=Pseudaquabacterium terrae TaxID=2732868 RepID=A0ABX2EPW2_9BURK|nr:cell envelope integrity protein TolA [Aquabacterium terrae]